MTAWPSPRKGPVAKQWPALPWTWALVQALPSPFWARSLGARGSGVKDSVLIQTDQDSNPAPGPPWLLPHQLMGSRRQERSLVTGLEGWTGAQALESDVRVQIMILTLRAHAHLEQAT